jgi:hypothetical protein
VALAGLGKIEIQNYQHKKLIKDSKTIKFPWIWIYIEL